MKVVTRLFATALFLGAGASASAQSGAQPPVPEPDPAPLHPPIRVPTPGGEVIIATARDKVQTQSIHFAPSRRAGDLLFLSGRVAGIRSGTPNDIDNYKSSARRMFRLLGLQLRASGLDFKDVVTIHSFHAWKSAVSGPDSKKDQFEAFSEVKDEFMPLPYPAWTAVGVGALLGDGVLTEVEFIAYAGRRK